MPERFDDIVRPVIKDGQPRYHEVNPADFGAFGERRQMFVRCIEVLAARYPGVKVSISGEREALMNMGLLPGGEALIGRQVYRTTVGATTLPGAVRLSFMRRL